MIVRMMSIVFVLNAGGGDVDVMIKLMLMLMRSFDQNDDGNGENGGK